jgi:hypothetical protein
MMKEPVVLAACLFGFVTFSVVSAQSLSLTPNSRNLIGTTFAAIVIVVVFSFMAYAGFKVIKKWSNSQSN